MVTLMRRYGDTMFIDTSPQYGIQFSSWFSITYFNALKALRCDAFISTFTASLLPVYGLALRRDAATCVVKRNFVEIVWGGFRLSGRQEIGI